MFPQLLAGALLSGGLALGKAIFGGIQASKGSKQQKKLLANQPQYSIPEAYQKALGIAQQMATQEMPGMEKYKDMYAEATARAMTGAERGAISSNVYQGAVQTAQDKELQALQQLAVMGAQYKTSAMLNLQQAQTQMGTQQEKQWEMNVLRPWDIRANIAQENRVAGWQNLYGGLSDLSETVMKFAGTKYYQQMMEGLYKK